MFCERVSFEIKPYKPTVPEGTGTHHVLITVAVVIEVRLRVRDGVKVIYGKVGVDLCHELELYLACCM